MIATRSQKCKLDPEIPSSSIINMMPRCSRSAKNGSNQITVKDSMSPTRIPKHNAQPKYFRTFQAQTDFTELQRKWAAKLGKRLFDICVSSHCKQIFPFFRLRLSRSCFI